MPEPSAVVKTVPHEMRPMDESLRAQIETYLSHLDGLIRRGREVRDTLATDPSNASAIAATRAWQEDCGVTINQLSGGSKAHWLARSFSEAFLMRSADGRAIEGAPPAEIVNRLLGVLEQAVGSLSRNGGWPGHFHITGSACSSPIRFRSQPSNSGPFWSKPIPMAGAPSSKATMTWLC